MAGGFSTSYLMLLLTRVAPGALSTTASPAIASLIGDLFEPGERGRIYGFILAGELVGAGFGLVLAGDVGGALGVPLAASGLMLLRGKRTYPRMWRRPRHQTPRRRSWR